MPSKENSNVKICKVWCAFMSERPITYPKANDNADTKTR